MTKRRLILKAWSKFLRREMTNVLHRQSKAEMKNDLEANCDITFIATPIQYVVSLKCQQQQD